MDLIDKLHYIYELLPNDHIPLVIKYASISMTESNPKNNIQYIDISASFIKSDIHTITIKILDDIKIDFNSGYSKLNIGDIIQLRAFSNYKLYYYELNKKSTIYLDLDKLINIINIRKETIKILMAYNLKYPAKIVTQYII